MALKTLFISSRWTLVFLVLFIGTTKLTAQTRQLDIKVVSKENKQPIEFANIFIRPCECGGATDERGRLQVELLRGRHQIMVSYIGFITDTSTVMLESNESLTISLEPQGYFLDNVTVTGQDARRNLESTTMGVQSLSSDKLEQLPVAVGEVDVFRSLGMLAGVNSAGEASNGLSVRGGSLDQNLVLMDQAPIFNPTHLFGLFSVFTPEAVGGVELYRANVPARYGGRIASVVDVKIKNPDAESLTMSGGIGLVSSRLSVETPLIRNKLHILSSSRISFNDFAFSRIRRLKNTRANFWDTTLKLRWQAGSRNQLFFTGFYSHDFYEIDLNSRIRTVSATSNQYDYATLNATLNWVHTLTDGGVVRTTLVRSDYQPEILFPQENSDAVIRYQSGIRYHSFQSEWARKFSKYWSGTAGIQSDHVLLQPGRLLLGQEPGLEDVALAEENGLESSVFAEADWSPNERLSISAGLRYTHFLLLGPFREAIYEDSERERLTAVQEFPSGEVAQDYGGLEPRLGIRYRINDKSSVKASYALTRQYMQNIYNSTTPLPTSRWKMADPHIQPQVGHTYSLGYYRNLRDNQVTVSLEGYFRDVSEVLDFKPGADFFLRDFIEQDVLQGKAYTYGLEFNLAKPLGNINGWFNYTWSRSLRQFNARQLNNRINNNEWFASDFDRPHVFNGTVSMKANDFNTFSFNFTFQSGRPYTIPNASFVIENIPVPIFLERNNARLPAYHRLDFSWRIHNITTNKDKRWKGDWILTIYNLYSRKNAYNRYFGEKGNPALGVVYGGPLGAYELSIFNATVLSLTYSFKFQ